MNPSLTAVTFTGADDAVNPNDLAAISREYPFVEWGILLSSSRIGPIQGQSRDTYRGGGLYPQFIVWCDLNAEQEAIDKALDNIGISYSSLYGSDGTGWSEDVSDDDRVVVVWGSGEARSEAIRSADSDAAYADQEIREKAGSLIDDDGDLTGDAWIVSLLPSTILPEDLDRDPAVRGYAIRATNGGAQ